MLTTVIDVSHWQNKVDWAKLKKAGIDGVYIKCTQGLKYSDPVCLAHATSAKANNLKVGYYHFATLTEDATGEAMFFLNRLHTLPTSDLIPMLDIEENKSTFSQSQVESWMHLFIETVKSVKEICGIYSYTSFLDLNLPVTHPFGIVPLWIAQYRNVLSPSLPHGWNTACLWQYTNTGSIEGIPGTYDLSHVLNQSFVI